MLIAKVESRTIASDATNIFAFDDDYSMGIRMSRAHDAWAWAQSSTLETRLRYTPTTVFESFPWPDPASDAARQRVAAAASTLDVAVAAAYGWSASVAQDAPELVRRLTERNRKISEGELSYRPFADSARPV